MSKEAMLGEIGRYIDDPNGVEAEYAKNAVNQGTYTPDGGVEVPTDETAGQESAPDVPPLTSRPV